MAGPMLERSYILWMAYFVLGCSSRSICRWSNTDYVVGTVNNESNDCHPSGLSSNRVYVFKFVMFACDRILHSPVFGYRQPFRTAISVTVILVVFASYIFTSVGVYIDV